MIEPVAGLMVEVIVRREGPTVEEVRTHVADRSLDLALGLRSVGPAGPDPEVMMARKTQELGVLGQATSVVTLVLDDDGLHLVEQ